MNRALLVSIEQYANVGGLDGCHNDAKQVRELLLDLGGFIPGDIRVRIDDQATASVIKQDLKWLTAGVGSGDKILFHYAGHGSEMPIDGIAHDVIVPYDFDWTPEKAVSDDDFTQAFQSVPGDAYFDWISDSCNSGGLTKGIPRFEQSRYLVPPPDIQAKLNDLKKAGQVRGLASSAHTLNLVLFAACRGNEEANGYPIDGQYHGILTYYLVSTLRNPATRRLSATDLNQAVINNVAGQFPGQHPELHGDPSLFPRPFLGGLAS